MALTKIDDRGLKTPIDLLDNEKVRLGTGNDLELFHDSTDSWVKNINGKLRLCNTNANGSEVKIGAREDQDGIIIKPLGATELYHNGSKKFETTSTGTTVTGILRADEFRQGDDEKVRLGNSEDLEIFHDATDSWVKNITGKLRLCNTNGNGNEVKIGAREDQDGVIIKPLGATEIYHNGSKKCETSANGINLDNSGGTTGFGKITFGNSGQQYIEAKDSGNFGSGAYVSIGSGTDVGIKAKHDNAVELYYDNSKKLETTADGITIGGDSGVTGNWQLETYNGSGSCGNVFAGTTGAYLYIQDTGSSEKIGILANGRASITSYKADDPLVLSTTDSNGTSDRLIIEGDGDIRIPQDNKVLSLGASQDLQIYTDAENGYVKAITANLWLRSDTNIFLSNEAGDEYFIKAANNGGCELYHDNSKKAETVSDGFLCSGNLRSNQHIYLLSDSHKLQIGAGQDLSIYHDGSHSYIDSNTGTLYIRHNGEYGATFTGNGDVSLYYDNTLKFYTTSNGSRVENGDLADTEFRIFGGPSDRSAQLTLTADNGAAHDDNFRIQVDYNHHFAFYAKPSGTWTERFRMTTNGDLTATDTTIGSLSDSRLKKNTADFTYDLAKFKQFKPKTYEWINIPEHQSGVHRGFLAQDIESVDSHLVSDYRINDDSPDKSLVESDQIAKSAKLGTNDAMYISVIQQLMTKIETLETKVAALEAG